jgi:hypothetical protein
MDQLSNFVAHSSHPALQAQPGQASSESGPTLPRRLNPLFVEWLMGWPSQWTKAEPSASSAEETASWRFALQQHLCNLLDEPASQEATE